MQYFFKIKVSVGSDKTDMINSCDELSEFIAVVKHINDTLVVELVMLHLNCQTCCVQVKISVDRLHRRGGMTGSSSKLVTTERHKLCECSLVLIQILVHE